MTQFAFLRSVNLGKHNKVPMKELVAALEETGLGPVDYLLASRNLVFREGVPGDLRDRVKELILERFGVETDVILRDTEQLQALLDANPFGVPEAGSVQISIWDGSADPEGLRQLLAADHSPDELHPADNALIIRYAGSSHDSKLNNNLIIRRLKVQSTLRNVRTFSRLLEKFGSGDAAERCVSKASHVLSCQTPALQGAAGCTC